MIDYLSATTNNNGLAYPDTLTINATGAGTGDGTELVKVVFDQIWGMQYALMDAAGLTPDSVTEAPDTSQILDAIRKISGSPGEGVTWWKSSDPATTGDRVLLLTGQVILIADYPELVAATYVGDGNNPTASAFYKTSDAGGTTRSISGTYFVLPDTRGYVLRGLDTAASVDPDGASRDVGSIQGFAVEDHYHEESFTRGDTLGSTFNLVRGGGSSVGDITTGDVSPSDAGSGAPAVATETRMVNVATKYGIRY